MSNGILPSDVTSTTNPIILKAMETVWGCSPHPFQLKAIRHLCFPYYNGPPSVLLVQGTATGKSTIMQMVLMIMCSVSSCLYSLWHLTKKARSSMHHKMQALCRPYPVLPCRWIQATRFHACHLWSVATDVAQHKHMHLLICIAAVPPLQWIYLATLIDSLISWEYPQPYIHWWGTSYLQFGQSFHQEFWLLQDCLFSHLRPACSDCLAVLFLWWLLHSPIRC